MTILDKRGRDRLHIMAQILRVTMDGALKTQIMYKASLSFAQLNEYLSLLLKLGLLDREKEQGKTIYRASDKGFEYLHSYEEIEAIRRGEYGERRHVNELIRMRSELRGLKKSIDRLETTLMSSVECTECQEIVFSHYRFCPYCGKELQLEQRSVVAK